MGISFLGFGKFTPEHVVKNDDFSAIMDTNDEWIQTRTGIKERRFTDKSSVDMAIGSAKDLIAKHNVDVKSIDLVIVATTTSNTASPTVAALVLEAIGAENAMGFDLNSACTGFVFASQTAHAFIESGRAKTALVIGTEKFSHYLNFEDRGTAILFGDGSAAGLLTEIPGSKGIIAEFGKCKGAPREILSVAPMPPTHNSPWNAPNEIEDGRVMMNGQEVYKFAVRAATEATEQVLAQTGWDVSEIDHFVLHQANKRIIEHISKTMNIPLEKFFMNLDRYGNTSSASVPLVLAEMEEQNMLKRGQKILIVGFGGGLSWGGIGLEY